MTLAPSLPEKRSPISTKSMRHPSTVRRSKRQQQNPKIPRTVEPLNLFGLPLPDRWEDTDGGGSKLSNWSPFDSAGPVSPNASNAVNDQNSRSNSAFECTTERSVLEEYRPLDYSDTGQGQVGRSFGYISDRQNLQVEQPREEARVQVAQSPTRAVQTSHDEYIAMNRPRDDLQQASFDRQKAYGLYGEEIAVESDDNGVDHNRSSSNGMQGGNEGIIPFSLFEVSSITRPVYR